LKRTHCDTIIEEVGRGFTWTPLVEARAVSLKISEFREESTDIPHREILAPLS
jgi:hypothetical protein